MMIVMTDECGARAAAARNAAKGVHAEVAMQGSRVGSAAAWCMVAVGMQAAAAMHSKPAAVAACALPAKCWARHVAFGVPTSARVARQCRFRVESVTCRQQQGVENKAAHMQAWAGREMRAAGRRAGAVAQWKAGLAATPLQPGNSQSLQRNPPPASVACKSKLSAHACLVKIDEPQAAHTRPQQQVRGVRPHALHSSGEWRHGHGSH